MRQNLEIVIPCFCGFSQVDIDNCYFVRDCISPHTPPFVKPTGFGSNNRTSPPWAGMNHGVKSKMKTCGYFVWLIAIQLCCAFPLAPTASKVMAEGRTASSQKHRKSSSRSRSRSSHSRRRRGHATYARRTPPPTTVRTSNFDQVMTANNANPAC